MIDWSRFIELVNSHRRFALTTHVRPDGDALGCEMAMAGALEALGKDVLICNPFDIPPNLRFLDPLVRHRRLGTDLSADDLADREVFIILDTSAWAQLGAMGQVLRDTKAIKVVVDHHISEDDLGAEVFKDTEAEAAGRLVVEAIDQLGVPFSERMAAAAFVALATDTGWFRFASTRADTLRLAARLVEAGAVPDQLYKELYETDSLARLRLIGRALDHSRTELGGRLVHTWLDQRDFAETGSIPSDSEDIINMTLAVGGTEAAIILVQQPDGRCKGSLRSRCQMDCREVAERFGGGGHRKAAGLLVPGPLDEAMQKLVAEVSKAMEA
jgi:phosphoesterase RecJ-like protein